MSDKKGYWIAHVDITEPAQYEGYKALAPAAFAKFGGEYLARGGEHKLIEGQVPGARHVVIEFPSLQAAIDCYNSPEYVEAKSKRDGAGLANIIMVEGV
ncbi:MAG: DUF1330 domain-containing protein [Rhodobacteraceae bacterium]|nr:DUF1330 domain-containing protein [Paracoccaceae bacterium]